MILSRSSIQFGNVEVGQVSTQNFQITNTELYSLTVSLSFNNSKFTSSTMNYLIPVSGSQIVSVDYNPVVVSDDVGRLTLNTNDSLTPIVYIDLTGSGKSAIISLSRTFINFGDVSYQQEKTEYIEIRNSSTFIPLRITNIIFTDTNFSVQETYPIVVTSYEQVLIKFTANVLISHLCEMKIFSNDIDTPVSIVSLSVNVTQPEIVVSQTTLDFNVVAVAQLKQENILISNYDFGDLHVLVSSTSPEFLVSPSSIVVSAASNASLSLTFAPVSQGNKTAEITLSTNDPDHPSVVISVEGTAKNSEVTLSKTSISFGTIALQDSKQDVITIRNIGTVEFIVSDIIINNSCFSVSSTSFSFSPGNSYDLVVTFKPIIVNSFSGTLILKNNNSSGNIVILLSGKSVSAGIYVNRSSIDFGAVTIRDSKIENLLVSNISTDDVDLILNSVMTTNHVFRENVESYRVKKDTALQLPITFSPEIISPQTGKLQITCNDNSLPLVEVSLAGSGIVASNIVLSTSRINFGAIEINQSVSKTFRVFNSGVVSLIISNITSNSSKFVITPHSGTIPPSAALDFQVTFTPINTNIIIAKILIASNDPDTPEAQIELQGVGVSPTIEIFPIFLEFGNITVSESKIQNFTIYNRTTVGLVISGIDSSNSKFSLNEVFPLRIESQKSVNVKFTPTNISLEQALITVHSNDINNPSSVISVSGTGVAPDISVQPISLDFFNVSVGQEVSLPVIISNFGLGKLIITSIVSSDPVFSPNVTSLEIQSKHSQQILIKFSPIVMGQKNTIIHLTNNDPDTPDIIIHVAGYGAYPIVSVSQSSFNFGPVVVGSEKEEVLSISNSGRASLNVAFSLNISEFSSSVSEMIVLPNSTNTIKIKFLPIEATSYSGVLTLATNDPSHLTMDVILTGSGIFAAKIVVVPRSINFGEVIVGRTRQSNVIVENQGTLALTFSTVIENSQVFSVSPVSDTVLMAEQKTLTVTYSPSDAEQSSGTLRISSNALNEALVSVSLSGYGKPAVLEWAKIDTSSWIPPTIKTIATSLSNIITPLTIVLDAVSTVLKIISAFIKDIDDPMKILLTQLKSTIANFINDLSATGIYMLYILPGKTGILPQTHPQYFRNLPPDQYNIFDPNNPSWFDSVKGGYSSFISKITESFDDPGDGNRPQFSSSAKIGGYVMMFDSGTIGPDDIAKFVRCIQKLMKMFRSSFKVAFEPPSNVTTFCSSNLVRVTFTPSVSVLPREYFIFRSETQGGDVVKGTDDNGNEFEYKDETGKTLRAWKLVGITNVISQLAKVAGVSESNAKTMLGEVGYAAKELSKLFLKGDAFRFVFEDTGVENDKSYFYVVASGYTMETPPSEYPQIIAKGILTSDFDKKIDFLGREEDAKKATETKISAVGSLSAEVSAKPVSTTLEVKGGLGRCRNFRCGFELSDEEQFTVQDTTEYLTLVNTPIAGSVKIYVTRQGKTFQAATTSFRVEYSPKSKDGKDVKVYEGSSSRVYIRSKYYYKVDDKLQVQYKYKIDLKTAEVSKESVVLGSDQSFLTKNKPIDSASVIVFQGTSQVSSSDVVVINDKDGRIKVNKNVGTPLLVNYSYYTDFSEKDFFTCIRSEYNRYFFDVAKCDAGATLCPGYDNASCYYNSGVGCSFYSVNSEETVSQRKMLVAGEFKIEDIKFDQFWDPVACQNGIMKQRCDGYSKTSPRYSQSMWPDWSSVRLSALGMFPKMDQIMKLMERLLDSLLAGTEKMTSATQNFIDLLQKKIDSLKKIIETVNSFIQILTDDFSLPDLYFLSVPYAKGGNEYFKTSVRSAKNGPTSDSSAYTAGVVLVYGTPVLGAALKLIFG